MPVKVPVNFSTVQILRISVSILLLFLQVQNINSTKTSGDDVDDKTLGKIVKKCSSKPTLKILNTDHELRKSSVIYNKTLGEIIIPTKTFLILECLSSHPIDFDFEGYLASKLYSLETARITDNNLAECYSIVVKFETKREATGKYVCWNIHEDRTTTASALYVYANGESPPYLLHGDISQSVVEIFVKSSEEHAVIPCVTTKPNVPVALYKIEREEFKILTLGNHISYDPKIGFKLNLRKIPEEPFGNYKCIAQNSTHFDVIVDLRKKEDNLNSRSNAVTHSEISTNKFPENQSAFLCTSSTSLSLYTTGNCKSVVECRLARKCLKGDTICGHSSCRCSFNGDKCSKSLRSKYYDSNIKLGDGCGTVFKNANGGVVQCDLKNGNEDQASSEMYFIGLKGKIILNWKDAPKSEILSISTVYDGNGAMYYVGEDIDFRCNASRFVFSKGFQWKFLLLNGSVISTTTLDIRRKLTDSYINEKVKIKISIPEIHSVICSAPIWNETSWEEIRLPLKVRDTVAPTFFDPSNITVTYYPNDKNESLICEASGYPSPDVMWLRNGEEFLTDFQFDNSIDNVTKAKLVFKEIAELDHGIIYTCNASNPRGMAFKTFSIHVKDHPTTLIFSLAGVGLSVFFAIVIFVSFILLRRMQKRKAGYIFHFSDFDMDEFTNGNPEAIQKCSDICEKAIYLPYDANIYEIEEDDLSIDYENILGQGEFGVVLKGKLTRNDMSIPVAVKTLKGSDMNHFKSILSELKIMIYIGCHKNIVTLLGAVTRNLIERRVSVVVEYCALGNLEIYLRQHRTTFLDEFGSGGPVANANATPYIRIEYSVQTSDLIRWAYEISTGMEYLATRKVIHGDLALRNMLMGSDQTVKITDFGLSKQLYKCTSNYVTRRKDVPLPWRWLAIETLQDYNFSTPSDVWSYGIVLWELFSLAEIPYAGVTFSIEFLRLLGNGYRLDRPRYCNPEIYSIMRECWRREASERPSFTTLRQDIAKMLPPGTIESDSELEIQSQNDTNRLKEDLLLPNRVGESIHDISV